jgi:hypothetical protein
VEYKFCSNPNSLLSPYVFSFSDNNNIPIPGQKAKEATQQSMFNKIFKMEAFSGPDGTTGDHLVGSHSIHKFVSMHMRCCVCNKDDKDICGCWKWYEDIELPYPDAKVAETLCIGRTRPLYFLFHEEVISINMNGVEEVQGASTTMAMLQTYTILSNVGHKICQCLPNLAALVLGKPLLVVWLIYSPCNETHKLR